MEIESNKYYTVQEVAEILNISSRKVCDMIRAGEIPAAVGNSAETWRVLGSILLNLGKSETEVTLPGDPALSEEERQAAQKANVARWKREQAEAEAAEAEANLKRDAATLKISPDEYIERLRRQNERTKKQDERETSLNERELTLDNEVKNQVGLVNEQNKSLAAQNRDLRLQIEKDSAEIKRLKQLLNNQEAIEVKRLDDKANFKENIDEAIHLIIQIYNKYNKLDEPGRAFARIIKPDVLFLAEKNEDPENFNECYAEALAAVKRIDHQMISLAGVYQESSMPPGLFSFKPKSTVDTGKECNYLCDQSKRLVKLLRLEDNKQEPEMPLR